MFHAEVAEKTQIKFDLETTFLCKEPLEMHKWSLLSSGMAVESCLSMDFRSDSSCLPGTRVNA